MKKENKEYKDSMFKDLFSIPENAVELVNALLHTNYKESDLENITLTQVLAKDVYNDLAFLTKDNQLIVLIEHQSTLNPNMPIRMLLYIAEEMKQYIEKNQLNLYRNRLISLPEPKFFVLYTNDTAKDYEILSLANAFSAKESPFLNLNVHCYNICKKDFNLIDSDTLKQYATFVNEVITKQKEGLTLKEALKHTVEYCKLNGILEKYLQTKNREVFEMYALDFNWDKIKEAGYLDGREDGFLDGKKAGEKDGLLLAAEKLIENGDSYEYVSKVLGLSITEIERHMTKSSKTLT